MAMPLHVRDAQARRWTMRRNCCLTPRQLMGSAALMCVLTAPAGIAFGMAGFPAVTAMVVLELAGIAWALCVHARHAVDREVVELRDDGALLIEARHGDEEQRTELRAHLVRIVRGPTAGALVRLAAHGRCVALLGTHLPPARSRQLEAELGQALAEFR